MTIGPRQPAFPTAAALLWLTGATVFGAAVAVLATPMFAGFTPEVNRAILAASVVAYVGSLLAMAPVSALGPWGVMPTVYGYFIGAALRAAWCMGAGMMLVRGWGLAATPTSAVLVWMYLLLLFVEVALVGRYLWAKDFLPKAVRSNGAEVAAC